MIYMYLECEKKISMKLFALYMFLIVILLNVFHMIFQCVRNMHIFIYIYFLK